MQMENRYKATISRMFRGSFGSCRTAGDSTDIVGKPNSPPQKHPYFRLSSHPPPPKTLPFPSICRPDCPETTAEPAADPISPRRKISPPSIPPSPPLNPFYKNPRKNNNKNKNNNKSNISYPRRNLFTSSSQDSAYYNGKNYLFSSDNEGEEDREDPPLNPFYKNPINQRKNNYSNNNKRDSISYPRRNLFTSSSQDSNYYNGKNYSFSEDEEEPENLPFSSKSTFSSGSSRRRKRRTRRRRRKSGAAGKVEGSFLVVKRSSDPYSDFRRSMVEMIVEKQIFAAYDLEQLLQCFLCLNSVHYHRVIVEVFVEIYDVLFSNLFD